jgi:hypothetical protein
MPVEALYSIEVARPTGFANLETRERMVSRLAPLVADEVVRDFAALHPSVQVVGKQKLRLLILAIFDSLLSNTYNQKTLSRQFGISEAGLSRLAGISRCPEPGSDDNGTLWAIAKRIAETHRDALEAA